MGAFLQGVRHCEYFCGVADHANCRNRRRRQHVAAQMGEDLEMGKLLVFLLNCLFDSCAICAGVWRASSPGSRLCLLGARDLLLPLLLGSLWGFAQLGAGICVSHLGLAIGSAVLNGIGAAVGTIIPLISLHSEQAFQASGILILTGIGMMLLGVGCCGWSGYLRESESRRRGAGAGFAEKEVAMRQSSYSGSAYLMVIGIAVASGVLASLTNIALAYSGTITRSVELEGGRSYWAPFAVWPIVFLGGSIANIGYAVYLMTKNKTWSRLVSSPSEPFNPFLAACLWMGGIALYSSGTTFLGSLGVLGAASPCVHDFNDLERAIRSDLSLGNGDSSVHELTWFLSCWGWSFSHCR